MEQIERECQALMDFGYMSEVEMAAILRQIAVQL